LNDVRPEHQLWGTVLEVPIARELVVATRTGDIRVRLLGVEPPEPPRKPGAIGQPFGEEALAYARDLLLQKQLVIEPHGKDGQGRLLAVVFLGEINVNLTLVTQGLAWVSPDLAVPAVRAPLEVAERQARVARYGLWSLPNPESPWAFRKRHRLAAQ
jgi:endonuclease YncB( thermonuclease family)